MENRDELLAAIALEINRWAKNMRKELTKKTRETLALHVFRLAEELFKVGGAEGLFSVFCMGIGLRKTLRDEISVHFTRKNRKPRDKKTPDVTKSHRGGGDS